MVNSFYKVKWIPGKLNSSNYPFSSLEQRLYFLKELNALNPNKKKFQMTKTVFWNNIFCVVKAYQENKEKSINISTKSEKIMAFPDSDSEFIKLSQKCNTIPGSLWLQIFIGTAISRVRKNIFKISIFFTILQSLFLWWWLWYALILKINKI